MKPYIIVWFLLLLLESITALIFSGDAIYVAKNRFLSGFWALASNSAPYKPAWVIKIGVIWFLNALFIGTILMSIAVKIRNKISQLFFVVIIFAIAMIQTANICLPLGINYGAAFLMWLWIGQQYSTLKTNGSKMIGFIEGRMGFLLVLLLWGAIVLLEFKTGNQYNICWIRLPLWGLELLGAFCGIFVIMGISRIIDRYFIHLASIFRYLGTISLWILCVHAIDVELYPKVFSSFQIGGYMVIGIRMIFDLLLAISLREIYKKTNQS